MQHVKHESFIAHIEELMLYFITILFTLHSNLMHTPNVSRDQWITDRCDVVLLQYFLFPVTRCMNCSWLKRFVGWLHMLQKLKMHPKTLTWLKKKEIIYIKGKTTSEKATSSGLSRQRLSAPWLWDTHHQSFPLSLCDSDQRRWTL